ncbi:hypothetical protein Syun_017022 [Stephania yunnanensis]|uniref:Uncharacterized protein n=1 Tax=Stephania yunnanensis TaxID=152371 RepID=A0AAP0J733_9MAGN
MWRGFGVSGSGPPSLGADGDFMVGAAMGTRFVLAFFESEWETIFQFRRCRRDDVAADTRREWNGKPKMLLPYKQLCSEKKCYSHIPSSWRRRIVFHDNRSFSGSNTMRDYAQAIKFGRSGPTENELCKSVVRVRGERTHFCMGFRILAKLSASASLTCEITADVPRNVCRMLSQNFNLLLENLRKNNSLCGVREEGGHPIFKEGRGNTRGNRRRNGRKSERTAVRERLEAGFTAVVRGGTGGRSGGSGGDKQLQRQRRKVELTRVAQKTVAEDSDKVARADGPQDTNDSTPTRTKPAAIAWMTMADDFGKAARANGL